MRKVSCLTNKHATKLLKQLYQNKSKNELINNASIINKNALNIYYDITQNNKNYYVINTLLKVFINTKQPQMIKMIKWNDIIKIQNVSYPLILKCLININNDSKIIKKCIVILQLIKSKNYEMNKYEITDYSLSVSKLITKCFNNKNYLNKIHELIKSIGHNDIYIYTSLITANFKLNDIKNAENIFNSINENEKDIACINSMLTGFINNSNYENALKLYDMYSSKNIDDIFIMLALKACIKLKFDIKGKEIINHKKKSLSKCSKELKHAMIEFYGEIGDTINATKLFNDINDNEKDIVSLGTMLKCLINNNYNQQALKLYDTYLNLINDTSTIMALKACCKINNFQKGKEIINNNNNMNKHSIQLFNSIIDFYGYFNKIDSAQHIFDSIKDDKKDIITINSLMTILNNNGYYQQTLNVYDQYSIFIKNGVYKETQKGLQDVAYIAAINACINSNNYDKGVKIYENIPNYLLLNIVNISNVLIEFYGNFGKITKAEEIFNSINDKQKDRVSINSIMKLYLNNNQYDNVLFIYDKYKNLTDVVSHFTAIKACMFSDNFIKGQFIHNLCRKNDDQIQDLSLKTTLIEFYGHFNEIEIAQELFDSIPDKLNNNVTINSMMKVYLNNDKYIDILRLYQKYTTIKDDISDINAIKACINLNDFEKGKNIHKQILKNENNLSIQLNNTLIDFYGHFKKINICESIFDEIKNRDIISINTMMEAYFINEMNIECIQLFYNLNNLKFDKIVPDAISFVMALKACTQSTSYHFGIKIHEILKKNYSKYLYQKSVVINLINFYGKCGMMNIAHNIFNDYCIKCDKTDILIYHAMIKGYGRNGNFDKIKKFYQLIKNNFHVDRKTYILLINAYNHCNDNHCNNNHCNNNHCNDSEIINEIENLWLNEINKNIKYDCYIITNIVDCFAKKGYLNKAKKLINEYQTDGNNQVHGPMYVALLNGCKMYKNKLMANEVFKEMNDLNIDDRHMTSASILLSNTFAS